MNVLVIPDTHCRNFWKDAVKDWKENIIFLGDYVDPYPFNFPNGIPDVVECLLEILEFADKNNNRVSLLIGNHGWSYLYDKDASRHDFKKHDIIKEIYSDYLNLLSVAKQYDDVLFTHAGVSKNWLERHDLILPKENADIYLNNIYNKTPNIFWEIGWSRGGWDTTGSPIWRDVTEQDLDDQFYQVYGHSYIKNPYITNKEACLDIGKSGFIIDTKTHNIITI